MYPSKKHKIRNIAYSLMTIILLQGETSCKKLIEIDPPSNQLAPVAVYNNATTATAALSGIYMDMSGSGSMMSGSRSIGFIGGLYADEVITYNVNDASINQFYRNNLSSTATLPWAQIYNYIFRANSAIEGLTTASQLDVSVKNQLLGEAKFIRAFCYFYLVNMYGDVPLVTVTDYNKSGKVLRTPITEVYNQISLDLKDASGLLNAEYLEYDLKHTSTDRIRPNKFVALALLSRVYLYEQQWALAEQTASLVIADNRYGLSPLDQVFLKNSDETIWSLPRSQTGQFNTFEGDLYLLSGAPNAATTGGSSSLSPFLMSKFETGDRRKEAWIGSTLNNGNQYYYPKKYKARTSFTGPASEYFVIFRIAEQYLIRAEARIMLGKVTGANSAVSDINIIRSRAGLGTTTADTQDNLLNAILQERQLELFTEWGHRWFDLKRTSKVDQVMPSISASKGGDTWASYKSLWPFPEGNKEVIGFPTLPQNPGYTN